MTVAEPRCQGCGCRLERDEPQPRYCVRCWMVPGWTELPPEPAAEGSEK